MMNRFLIIAALIAFSSVSRAEDLIATKVLYAGNPGSDREKEFATLLGKHFTKVVATDYRTFKESDANNYDVVIFDWTSIYSRDKNGKIQEEIGTLNSPKPPQLSELYDRPTILIGAAGESVVRPLRLKIDWRCLCLEDGAHGIVTSHAIFNTPLQVRLDFEDVPTPENYLTPLWGVDKKLGKTIKIWRVQNKKFPEIDPGLVSNPYGFDDSPDAEAISSGLNLKGPDSVALGRHGNFFLWGFSASPNDMTSEARKCFVNAVCYIKKFDGQRPIVRVANVGYVRQGALTQVYYLRHLFNEEEFKRHLPAALRDDPAKYAKYRESMVKYAFDNYPDEIRQQFGTDPEKYVKWITENLEYLRFEGTGYGSKTTVDEDAKLLGQSTRKIELLDTCVSMLEKGDRTELAMRLLKRYTNENFSQARAWRAWLETNRSQLFFTEIGGFKWMVAPRSLIRVPGAAGTLNDAKPKGDDPVAASVTLSPSKLRPGETAVLVVRVETSAPWHIYAMNRSGGSGVSTTLKLTLPEGVKAEGEWNPAESPIQGSDGQSIYEGVIEFRQKLKFDANLSKRTLRLACDLSYQACNREACQLPTRKELATEVELVEASPVK